jgi:toxin-antitoxin system, antitoxin component, xre family
LKRLKISLKAARVNANLSQEDVAKKMKKSKVTINNWENGKTEIDYGNLTELCRLYSVTMDDIILPY